MTVDLHSILCPSRANGPGLRMVLWFQGCSLGCPGCFNPDTHSPAPRLVRRVEELVAEITARAEGLEEITISGGEPLEQRPALLDLLQRLRRETCLSVLLFTGWEWREVAALAESDALLAGVDVLIAGRHEQAQRHASGLVGSANQTVHFLTDRYCAADLQATPSGEVTIARAGRIVVSGVDPRSLGRTRDGTGLSR